MITNVLDSAGGRYAFKYDSRQLLTNVSFGQWQVNFGYDSTNRLVSKTLTNTSGLYTNVNATWQFQYGTNGLLARIIDPRGNTNVTVQYDQYGRQTNQVDALGRATATRYGVPGNRQIAHVDPAGNSWVETYDRKGHILSQQDPLTNTTRYTYDEHGNRTSITEPLGWTTSFGYDDRANVVAKTNALGEVTRWSFHPFFNKATKQVTPQPPDANGWTTWTNFYAYDSSGNLTNHSDALGSLVSYTYATNGLVLSSTDANGHTTRFAHDTNGFLTACTDAAINTTTYVNNDVDWKLRETNPLGETKSYTYDFNGNLVRTRDAIGREFTRGYDENGNLLSASDGKSRLTTYAYDAANQRTNLTDRTGTNVWSYFFTSRGKLDRVTDPLGHSVTNTYDTANRLVQVTDPLGQSITNQYDANGNLVAFFDQTGQRWTKAYDRLNRVVAETDPLGDTRSTAYDVAGRIQQITSPNGYPSLHAYDGRGRLVRWTDPENYTWLYDYDGAGNITNITDALGGHYVMTYGPRNERTMERNQDNFEWHYAYDELLRLKMQTDPNGTTRTPNYDHAGRVRFVDFSTDRHDEFDYDDNDNLKVASRRAAGVTTANQFVYDPLDRVVEQDDALGQTVLYDHDPLGRVTTVTYPGGKTLTNSYDALGRLTNQVDWAGRQTTYAYDAADRLVRRLYPNGIVQTNTFDEAGRITSLTYSNFSLQPSTFGIALTYAYDRNGNKVGGGEKGTLEWPLPALTDETSRFTPASRLIDRTIHPFAPTGGEGQGEGAIRYSYDSSGNMTNAVQVVGGTNAQSWTLTYDEDNRTTSIVWATNGVTHTIQNRYDALGRRISKTQDGVTTGYVLNLSGGMERILCDLDASGNATAWYVHGPDLSYRVDATNGLTCYHADAMANILALTDGNTNLVAQYAYTPYGRVLGSTTVQPSAFGPQPFLFAGSQGVMEELPGLYFMRARYYSADAGVFLSTDPVKKIGPGWKPVAYEYAGGNPISQIDPMGETPAHLAAFLLGIQHGMIEGVFESAVEETLSVLPTVAGLDAGAAESITGASFDVLSAGQTAYKTVKYAQSVAAAGDPSRMIAAYTLGETAGGKIGGAVFGFSKFLADNVARGGQAIGNRLNQMLFQRVPSVTLNSPTAGTTPMAVLPATPNQSQAVSFSLDGNGSGGGGANGPSLSSRTVTAGSYAQSVTAATSTKAAASTSPVGTTTQVAGGTSSANSGGGAFAKVATAVNNAANSISQTVRNVVTTVGQAITSAVKSIGGFFSSLFGGGRP